MKQLELRKTEINTKTAKYRYDVIEDDKILCSRKTHREYVACNVLYNTASNKYYAPNYFGRMDLIGKSGVYLEHCYALATLKQ